MVNGAHPTELELFDYVEGELDTASAETVHTHLARCAECAGQVERVQAGRDALRGSQFLQLPERRREGVLVNLPTRRRPPGERGGWSWGPKQLIAVLTPVAAIIAVVAILANTTGQGSESQAGATAGGGEAAGGGAVQEPTRSALAGETAYSAAGTPADVAAELRDKGFRAEVQRDSVVVRGASKQRVRQALADRGPGEVAVIVQPR
jgi:anti-sigma factor RsiW